MRRMTANRPCCQSAENIYFWMAGISRAAPLPGTCSSGDYFIGGKYSLIFIFDFSTLECLFSSWWL